MDRFFFRFVTIYAFDGQTDGRTDPFLATCFRPPEVCRRLSFCCCMFLLPDPTSNLLDRRPRIAPFPGWVI